ncbi:MAG: T9SS type A sorting domain-containing protein, partial [Chitinophagales bacterium]|nr:T9SS type A sorting domain-containing protein [Chitinophagales bacterium]
QSVCGTQPLNESVITMGPDFTTPPMRFGEDVNTSFEVEVFPNPASENATISFSLDEESQVRIALMDVNGKLIKEIANAKYSEGIYQLSFNSKDLSSGVYLIQLTTNEELVSKKLVIER